MTTPGTAFNLKAMTLAAIVGVYDGATPTSDSIEGTLKWFATQDGLPLYLVGIWTIPLRYSMDRERGQTNFEAISDSVAVGSLCAIAYGVGYGMTKGIARLF